LTGPAGAAKHSSGEQDAIEVVRFAGKHPQRWVIRANGASMAPVDPLWLLPEVTNKNG
jgi:hypothetical protein